MIREKCIYDYKEFKTTDKSYPNKNWAVLQYL